MWGSTEGYCMIVGEAQSIVFDTPSTRVLAAAGQPLIGTPGSDSTGPTRFPPNGSQRRPSSVTPSSMARSVTDPKRVSQTMGAA